jgi:hypothetical protein
MDTSARPADDRLDALFRCEHIGKSLAVRHCLRRQNERKQTKHPKTMKLFAGEPEHGYCATACAQGRAVRAEHADVPAGHCERCGTAYVGADAAAAPCGECVRVRAPGGTRRRSGARVPREDEARRLDAHLGPERAGRADRRTEAGGVARRDPRTEEAAAGAARAGDPAAPAGDAGGGDDHGERRAAPVRDDRVREEAPLR